ncbi:MAG: helicase-exonuclease AddAB subunit AddA [Oscillospiraceae bacterium]|nr:helicase-exonuclease AddAB subunit AddA [Oscillospiraceae bacterium]
MAEFNPTKAQSYAIETKGRAVLVSAAAGSGKTKVLTERLLARIADPSENADVDSFLIITFTKAAAAELRSRIMDEIAARLTDDPENKHLRRQSALCQRSQIGTIHSFCGNLLRENCHAAGLSPEFKIIEEDRSETIKSRVIDKVMEAQYECMTEGFKLLTDTVGRGRDDARLAELTVELHKKMQSHPLPDKWAKEQTEALSREYSDAGDTPWGREVLDSLRLRAAFWAERMERLAAEAGRNEKVSAAYGASVAETAASLRGFVRALDIGWDAARSFLPIDFPRLGTLRNSPDPELSEYVKAVRKKCGDTAKHFSEVLSCDSEKLLRDMRRTAPAMQELLKLTLEFDRAYSAEKRRRSEVDFSDLEHMAYRLLSSREDIAASVSARFTEIMVDEYQDVNAVQDAIFRAVSKNGENLFMVGDVKQSIYRFRLADPSIFTEKYNSFSDLETAKEKEPVRIMLQENFRSRSEIIDAANHVFRTCMSEKLGDIAYDKYAELKCGASYEGNVRVPELTLINLNQSDEESLDKTETEAAFAAESIRKLIDSGTLVTDRGVRRPARYSDIAILMRSANSVGGVYRRALTEAGIPVMNGQGGSFFDSMEVSGILSLLTVVDNPCQDVPLISALRSPFFGFSADELSEIRAADRKSDFYSALLARAEENVRCGEFLDRLRSFRDCARDMELGAFIYRIYDELDAFAVCSAMRDGENRCANLNTLLEYAKRFEATGYRGLHRFTEWLGKLNERGEEPGRGSTGNAVQIMTVHKSKGLEFPIVFLCDTNRLFNRQDSRSAVLVHPELGLGPKVTDTERGIEYNSLARNAIKLRSDREMLSEEMRLLYVAMTRAKEYLFMTAAMKEPEEKLQKLMPLVTEPMSPEVLMSEASSAQWLMLAALADNAGRIRLNICCPERAEETESTAERLSDIKADEEIKKRIANYLAFRYVHDGAVGLPSKVTATELKSREEDPEVHSVAPGTKRSFRSPDFLRDKRPLSGTEKGTATHMVLQFMDYGRATDIEGIRAEIERLKAGGFISERQAQGVDAEAIRRLFASDIGRRIMNADAVSREFKFSLLCPAEDFFPGGEGESVLLQGVMDCCIEEEGELTVVDYKTDSVYGEALEARAESYKGQLRAYALAAERMTGRRVRECVLYFLTAGRAFSFKNF